MICISWVGSDARELSTREEIYSSGLARELGRELQDWWIVRRKIQKAEVCQLEGIGVFLDDNQENIALLRNAHVYVLPINSSHVQHEDGYRDLSQALSIEGILTQRPVQDR